MFGEGFSPDRCGGGGRWPGLKGKPPEAGCGRVEGMWRGSTARRWYLSNYGGWSVGRISAGGDKGFSIYSAMPVACMPAALWQDSGLANGARGKNTEVVSLLLEVEEEDNTLNLNPTTKKFEPATYVYGENGPQRCWLKLLTCS